MEEIKKFIVAQILIGLSHKNPESDIRWFKLKDQRSRASQPLGLTSMKSSNRSKEDPISTNPQTEFSD